MIELIVNIVVFGSVAMFGLAMWFLYAFSKAYESRNKSID